jgi:hemolysin III
VTEPKPLLRGYLHLGAAVAAAVGCVVLLLLADSPRAYAGGAVFALSLMLLYATSAAYHIVRWGDRARAWLQRLDHSMIFVLIAGSYTPFCLVALSTAMGIAVLAIVWSVAAMGIALKVAWPTAPRWLGIGLYLTAGWVSLVAATELTDWFAVAPLALLFVGGVLYSAGGVIYGLRRPNPFPRVFGYHEVFHALTIIAASLHYAVVAGWVMPA